MNYLGIRGGAEAFLKDCVSGIASELEVNPRNIILINFHGEPLYEQYSASFYVFAENDITYISQVETGNDRKLYVTNAKVEE